jgi:YVTN family beta-propeller protein
MSTSAHPKVFLAGRVAVETERAILDEAGFPGRQSRIVFAYLVAEQGRPVSRDELAEALWGEAPPATWDKALSGIVGRVRGVLSNHGIGPDALTAAFGCYRLELPEGSWVDVIVAAHSAQQAEAALGAGELESATAAAALAVSLLQEPFVPGEGGAWVAEKRRELADVRDRALRVLADASLRSGDPAEAVKWAEKTIAIAPFRETGYRRLMEAHVAAGNRAEALRVYEQCRQLLAEELGTYPSPETESFYRQLLEPPRVATPTAAAQPPESAAPPRGAVPSPAGRRRRILLLGCAAVATATATATAAAVMLLARDGPGSAIAEISADSIGVLHSGDDHPSGQIEVGAAPSALAFGAGSLWVANIDAHTVSRIDPAKQVVIDTIQVGTGPAGIAFGDGKVWVTNGTDGTVDEISPQTDTVVDTIRVGNGPAGIAVGAGYVWVANSRDGTVTPIEPRTGTPFRPIPIGRSVDGVAVGYGSIWATSGLDRNVTRIDPRTQEILSSTPAGSGAGALAIGAGGVWVANSLDSTVTRVDPERDTVAATIPVGDGPSGVVINADDVWVSNELAGTLTKIDPLRNVPAATVATGNRPEGIVGDADSLFIAVRASGAGHRGGTLRVLLPPDNVTTVDPALTFTPETEQVVVLTNDGLTGFRKTSGSAGLGLVPDLAVSLPTPTDRGRSYTFRLRPGLRYSTGALIRPEDVRWAIERSLRLQSPLARFDSIIGAKRCIAAPRKPCDLSRGIETHAGSNAVTFHLTAPDSDFLHELALPAAYPLPEGTPLHPRGFLPATGPYEVASFDRRTGVSLVRNPWFHEWSPAAQPSGFPNAIVERFGESPETHVAAVLGGSADLATDLSLAKPSAAVLQSLRTQHPDEVEINPWINTLFLVLNTRAPPFDDVRARKALNFAIDRERLRDLTLGPGLGSLTCQLLPPGLDGYRRYCPYTARPNAGGAWIASDLKRARHLVRASGTAGEAVTLWIPRWIHHGPAAGQYVVSVLNSIGYNAHYRFADNPYPMEDRLHLQVGFFGWGPDFGTPSSFIPQTLTCAAYNRVNSLNGNTAEFCDPAIDRKIRRARSLQTSDPDSASRLWAEIDRRITDQAPWVPYANGAALEVKSTRVGNYQYNPQWGTLLDQLWVR